MKSGLRNYEAIVKKTRAGLFAILPEFKRKAVTAPNLNVLKDKIIEELRLLDERCVDAEFQVNVAYYNTKSMQELPVDDSEDLDEWKVEIDKS